MAQLGLTAAVLELSFVACDTDAVYRDNTQPAQPRRSLSKGGYRTDLAARTIVLSSAHDHRSADSLPA
jgi:hypothetical protein